MPLNNPALVAGEKIAPATFVTISAAAGKDHVALQGKATSTELIIGISQDGSKLAPLPGFDTSFAAEAGDPIQIYGPGDVCLVKVGGAADLTAGVLVGPDADGAAIKSAAGKNVGAITLESASKTTNTAQPNLVRVLVLPPGTIAL